MIDEKVLIERLEEKQKIDLVYANEKLQFFNDGAYERYVTFMKAIEIVKDLAEEHNSRIMIDGQYCWQTCGATEHCKECNRLSNGDIDYYENWDCLIEEQQSTWKQNTMSRFERVE